MRFAWNDSAFSWESVVLPGDDVESGAGPVGPAGVNFVRVGDASISFCAMTGRVTAAWLPVDPDEREAALYELVFGRGFDAVRFSRGGAPFDDSVLAVPERIEVTRWAALSDTLRHLDFGAHPDDSDAEDEGRLRAQVACLFANLEMASSLIMLEGLSAAGSAVVSRADIEHQLRLTDDLATRLTIGSGVLDAAQLVKGLGIRKEVHHRLSAVGLALSGVQTAHGAPGSMCLEVTEALLDELRPPALGGRLGTQLLDRQPFHLSPIDTGHVAVSDLPELPCTVSVRGGRLAATAAASLGLSGEITVEPGHSWLEVSATRIARPSRDEHPWVLALAADRTTILGGSALELMGSTATARIFVTDASQVAWLQLERNPLGRPHRGVRWSTHGAADTAARAGVAALQRGYTGLDQSFGAANLIFAEVAIAWLHLGSQFKAGWSWTLADRDEGVRRLAELGISRLEPVLDRMTASSAIPSKITPLPAPLWTLAIDIRTMLPSPVTDPTSQDELFLISGDS